MRRTGDTVLETFGFNPYGMRQNVSSLGVMSVIWLVVSYLLLRFKRS